jgi:hypothetical protein
MFVTSPKLILGCAVAFAVFILCPSDSEAVTVGHVDDFEDGTTQGWMDGGVSSNPPIHVLNVGPAGAGDDSLHVRTSGVGGAGGRFVTFSFDSDWTGDYTGAGVTAIEVEVNNFGVAALDLRLALNGAGGWFTTAPVAVATGGGWLSPISFPVTSAGLSYISGGTGTLSDTLTSVSQIELYSAAGAPLVGGGGSGVPKGDVIDANAYFDNISAIPEPSTLTLAALGLLSLGMTRRRRRR